MGVGSGGGLVAVGVSVGSGVLEGVGVGPRVGDAVAVAVFVAVAGGVGDEVAVAIIGGDNVLVGDGGAVVIMMSAIAVVVAPGPAFSSAAWLTSSGRLANMPNADSTRTTRKSSPTQPMPSN